MHGGSAPQVKATAARRAAVEDVRGQIGEMLDRLGLDPSAVNHTEVLVEQVRRAHAVARLLQLEVGKRDVGDLYGLDHLGDARPHVLMVMLREWTDEAARLSKMAIDVGVDERQVHLAESMASQLVEVQTAVVAGILSAVRRLVEQGGVTEAGLGQLERVEVPRLVRGVIEAHVLSANEGAA